MQESTLLSGNITKSLLIFALPMIAGNLLQQCYNIADTIIVGRFLGANALAAVGSAYTLMVFLTSIMLGLCMGSGASFSISYGRGDRDRLRTGIFQSFVFIGLVTLVINVLVFVGCDFIIWFLRVGDAEVADLMKTYLLVIFAGIAATFLQNYFSCLLRALGNSKVPLVFLAVSAVMNIVLDLLFVCVFYWGVAGAALATILSQWVSGIGLALYTLRAFAELRPERRHMRWDGEIFHEITSFSFLTCIQQSVMNFGILLVQGLVNSFGPVVMAAFAAAVKIDSFAYMPVQDFGNAFSTFIAQNYGAGQYRRILTTVRKVFVVDLGLSVLCSLVLFFGGEQIVGLFMTDYNSQIVYAAKEYLFAISLCYSLVSVLFVLRNTLQGLGCTYANAVAGAGELIGRITVSYLFTPLFGFKAVCFAGPVAWLLADLPLIVLYWRKAKQMRKLSNQ